MLQHVTASRARSILERHGLTRRRSLGQHFLVDPNTVRKILRLAGLGPEDTVLEIGPGLGSLTVALAEEAARVVALELDEGLAGALREVVDASPNVEVVVGDALRADLASLVGGRARLVANLPYNVATPIFARVLESVPQIVGGLVMVQRELGERWTSPPGSKAYGAISVKVAYYANARVVADVPPTVFLPPPAVSSVLVSFARRPPPVDVADLRGFFAFVESAFAHRRKTIRNGLAAAGLDRERVEAALAEAGVEASRRPETLSIGELTALHAALA